MAPIPDEDLPPKPADVEDLTTKNRKRQLEIENGAKEKMEGESKEKKKKGNWKDQFELFHLKRQNRPTRNKKAGFGGKKPKASIAKKGEEDAPPSDAPPSADVPSADGPNAVELGLSLKKRRLTFDEWKLIAGMPVTEEFGNGGFGPEIEKKKEDEGELVVEELELEGSEEEEGEKGEEAKEKEEE